MNFSGEAKEKIHLRPKTFAFLRCLVTQLNRLITKDELMNAIWRDCHVGEEALKHCVTEIRKALGDNADTPRFIETVHRRGDRFIGKASLPRAASFCSLFRIEQHQEQRTSSVTCLFTPFTATFAIRLFPRNGESAFTGGLRHFWDVRTTGKRWNFTRNWQCIATRAGSISEPSGITGKPSTMPTRALPDTRRWSWRREFSSCRN